MSPVWINIFFIVHTATAAMQTANYIAFTNGTMTVDMLAAGPTISAQSSIICATQCAKYVRPCYSYIFNKTSKLCTPGSSIVSSKTPFNSLLGILYYVPRYFCDNSAANFTFRSNGSVVTCTWVSNSLVNYQTAKQACRDLGSHLYTIKVPEKLYFLLDIAKKLNVEYWIGLDDIDVEGVYRWDDDNSTWNNNFKMFSPGKPDNFGNEDCIHYSPIFYPINDYPCSALARYICEISPSYFLT